LIGAALIVVAGVLVWFARRAARGDDDDSTGMWQALDADETESKDATESLRALARGDDSAMVVVEETALPEADAVELASMEMPVAQTEVLPVSNDLDDPLGDTGTNKSLEDTFSSDTAINLDQSDPIAEADFHMAYGLYDQAADLINGALAVEPQRQDLLTKLCEIYFVWGNRDAFVDAAMRLNGAGIDNEASEWDKIVIMGQQIAGDHEMFADAKPGAATKAVDMSFEGGTEETGALDMDFAVESAGDDDVIDLGASVEASADASAIDFAFDEPDLDASVTQQMPTAEASATLEMPSADSLDDVFEDATVAADNTLETPTVETPAAESTVESPTIEQQLEGTGQMPALEADAATEIASLDDLPASDETAEIDLDDLGLDLDSLAESNVVDVATADGDMLSDLDDTAESQTLKIDDSLISTGRNPMLGEEDPDATGQNPALLDEVGGGATGMHDLSDIERELEATGEMPTIEDVTGKNPMLAGQDDGDTDFGLDTSLLDATGQTQVLPEDFVVETGTGTNIEKALADDDVTMLASLDDDDVAPIADDAATLMASLDDDDGIEGDFDYAKTEALPRDAFSGDLATDETGVMQGIAGSTDMDLDLDDLTAALKVSAAADTLDQMRDDATVEQPRPNAPAEQPDESPTAAIAPEDLSGDLHDARTMTEVGTKLDLARAYVDMGDPSGARSILEEVLDEGDEAQRQQAQQLLDSLPS
jgi:pilus assembly protein FimV